MDEDEAGAQPSMQAGRAYPLGQLAKAFRTASGHEDAGTRERAETRVRQWAGVLRGMVDGTLTIGSRTPVRGLPEWVTPAVVRGGFATGSAAAGGPLRPHERETADRAGVRADRRALFAHHLTEPGLAELTRMLDDGRYRIVVPEEAALLTVAWLLRAGDRSAALALLDVLEPFAGRLGFAPRPGDAPAGDPAVVFRETAGDVAAAVARRRPNARVETMREALTVWNPFADELLDHWLETVEDGRVGVRTPAGWPERGEALVERYRALAAAHTRCSKHRDPKHNIAILRTALEDVGAGRALPSRRRGLLQHAVDAMVRRRGRPGSREHAALRERQAADAAVPGHHVVAQLVVRRLSALPQDVGVASVEPLVGPVTEEEERQTGVPAGTEVPRSIRRVVGRALSAPVETLVERGVVPSAEVLARLVPQIAATTAAAPYRDDALRALMAAHYRAFRNRLSLLLLNLERQVRIEDLPWVRAVAAHRDSGDDTRCGSEAALVRLGELALQGFPGTILPNRLVRELDTLAREAGLGLPFVEELAADIFTGTFSVKFARAARLAAGLLRGTLYERYYGIDYGSVADLPDGPDGTGSAGPGRSGTTPAFAALCRERAGAPRRGYSVAANGAVIEQSQILTTHNLATLAGPVGLAPAPGWPDLARRCFATVCRLVSCLEGNPRPLGTVKDAAYAWRQMLFFVSLSAPADQEAFGRWAGETVRGRPGHTAARLAPALAGLDHALGGGHFDADGTAGDGRRFLGWVVDGRGHWLLGV